tara:strand:+ start:391 stop:1401 length:1011 start_codon:yes stop_codon:yes gene_type:complete
LEALRKQQADINFNECNNHEESLLARNVARGDSSLVKYYLSIKGINVDARTSKGATPLYIAIRTNQPETALLLVEHGADLFLKTNSGDDALTAAKQLGNQELYDFVFNKYETRRISQSTNIIKEFIDTEWSFCNQLEILHYVFQTKLKSDLPVSGRALRSLFANLEDVYQQCRKFVLDLEGVAELPPEQQNVGQRIVNHLSYFRSFREYCKYQTISSKSLRVMQGDSVFREWLKGIEDDLKSQNKPHKIEEYLIKPVQRICRHQLLVRELLKYTSESYADYKLLERSAEEIKKVLNESNELKRGLDHVEVGGLRTAINDIMIEYLQLFSFCTSFCG